MSDDPISVYRLYKANILLIELYSSGDLKKWFIPLPSKSLNNYVDPDIINISGLLMKSSLELIFFGISS